MIQLEMKVGIDIQQKFNRKTKNLFSQMQKIMYCLPSDTGINFLFGKKN